jgi:predicted transposase/invertase (TIGR01784 family)
MTWTPSPHDKLIKEFLSNRETAASLFDNYLPTDIRETLRLETLEICKDSFVEPDLREFFSDLLYRVRFGDRSGYLYMLLEHKSHPEKHTALQVLGYIRGIWALHLEQATWPLPVIVPMVLYHGPRPWPYSTDLLSLIDGPDKRFYPYIPDFSFVLVDLFRFSDKDIKGAVLCRVSLLLLKHVFTPGYEDKIPDISSLLNTLLEKQTSLQYIETVIRYILTTAENMSAENLKQIVEEKLSAEQGALTMTIADRIRKEGMKEYIWAKSVFYLVRSPGSTDFPKKSSMPIWKNKARKPFWNWATGFLNGIRSSRSRHGFKGSKE